MQAPLPTTLALLLATTLRAQCPPGETQITVTLRTDQYGSESTWSLTGPNGAPVHAQGGPFADHPEPGSYPQPDVQTCVPDGAALTFHFRDAAGDGMCCSYGDGRFTIYADGVVAVNTVHPHQDVDVTFQAGERQALDLALISLDVPAVSDPGDQPVRMTVKNFGLTDATSFYLNYQVDNGTIHSEAFNTTLAVWAEQQFTLADLWPGTPGTHQVRAWVSNPNNADLDGYPVNDGSTCTTSIPTQVVDRVVVLEEFSSSTCGPCAGFNADLEPLLGGMDVNGSGSHVAAVRYQMDWPSPGDDPSYNHDGWLRRLFYRVNGIPWPLVDGHTPPAGWAQETADEVTNELTKPAFVQLELIAERNGNALTTTAHITPYVDLTSDLRLFVAVTEDHYSYPDPYTEQDEYYNVMRKVLPDGNGYLLQPFVDGVPQTVVLTYTLEEGVPEQGSNTLWGTPDSVSIVAFVQDMRTGAIYQGAIAGHAAVGIDEVTADETFQVFPNPSAGTLTVRASSTANADITVFDALGKAVYTAHLVLGNGPRSIDLAHLPSGLYHLQVRSAGHTRTRTIALVTGR